MTLPERTKVIKKNTVGHNSTAQPPQKMPIYHSLQMFFVLVLKDFPVPDSCRQSFLWSSYFLLIAALPKIKSLNDLYI